MFRRIFGKRIRWRRRVPSWVALAAQLATLVGLPLPAEAARKDRSTPFPCQHRACGCMNADDCWRSCCCFSARDRLSWTREHGQDDPKVLVDAAAREEADESATQEPVESSCCSSGQPKSKPCCEKTRAPKPAKPKAKLPVRWAFGISARGCHGKFGMLTADEMRSAADDWVDASFEIPLSALIPCVHEYSDPIPLPLDAPPPRSAPH